uniref:Shikimate O-hydroxycinnamoyltransferase n=1 Tax=Opuntia streptacantha TaxID=393608 RepID=A0A7C9ANV3_OPUST
MSNSATVEHISECFIKPKYEVEESKHPYELSPWDLVLLCSQYIQKGLLFAKPTDCHSEYSITQLLQSLKESLSLTLVHFYPLAGQLATCVDEDRHECLIFIDPNKGPGARFIHANLHMTTSDILSPADVPIVVQELFDHDGAVGHDGHTRPLLSVQVTELLDGIFIGVSFNHVVGDGTSYWHFWRMWSEIHRRANIEGKQISISIPPLHQRWVPEGYGAPVSLPFTHPDEFIRRYEPPFTLRARFFHFTSESIARLKVKANEESNTDKISSFQALSALIWRSIIRANQLPHNQPTNCMLAINNRPRLDPPLPQRYFGNSINLTTATTTVGELLEHNLGWAASMLSQSVRNYTHDTVHGFFKSWMHSRVVYCYGTLVNLSNVLMGSSPRFDMYGNEFGLGKAVAVRSGSANKYPGKVSAFPGCEGGGSVDLEICLLPNSMTALESDEEFMAAVSISV